MRDAEVLAAVDAGRRRDAGHRDPPLPPLIARTRPLTGRPDGRQSPRHDRRRRLRRRTSRPPTSPSRTSCASRTGRRVALAPDAVERIRASRAIVDALVDGPALIYGLNTGLGHLRDVRVPRETLRQYQELIVGGARGRDRRAAADAPSSAPRWPSASTASPAAASGASLPVAAGARRPAQRRRAPGRARRPARSGASDLMHMAAIAQVLIGHGSRGGRRRGPARRRGPRDGRPRARRPRAEGRPGAHLGQRRVDRAGGARRRACGPPRARRRPRARRVARGRRRATRRSSTPPSLAAKPVPGQLAAGAERPRVPRRQRAVHAGRSRARCRTRCRSGSGPQVHGAFREFIGDPRGRGDDRAQRDGRQPAGRRRVGPDAQQRQLPPHGARARASTRCGRPSRTSGSCPTGA